MATQFGWDDEQGRSASATLFRGLRAELGETGLRIAIGVVIATLVAAVLFIPGDAGREASSESEIRTLVHPCEAKPCRCAYCGG
jgi:hypothetical protein